MDRDRARDRNIDRERQTLIDKKRDRQTERERVFSCFNITEAESSYGRIIK